MPDKVLATDLEGVTALRGRDWARILEFDPIPTWFPLLLGFVLGIPLAYLLVSGAWHLAFALVLVVPMAILLIKYPFFTVIVWLLVSPLLVITPTADVRFVYWIIHRALVPIGLAIGVLSRVFNTNEYAPVRLGPAELAMGIFAGLVPVSILLFQPDRSASLINYYDRILVPYFMYLLVRLVTLQSKAMKGLLAAALVLALSQSAIGLLAWVAPQVLPSQWLQMEGSRTVGSLGQPGVYTAALIFAMALLLQAAMSRKPDLLRSVFIVAFGLGAVCVFLSLSRGSWLGGLFVAGGLLVLFPKPMLRMSAVLFLITVILGTTVLSTSFSLAYERIMTENTVQARIANSDALINMTKSKPLFGWGYENERRYTRQFLRQTAFAGIDLSSHNSYLTILAEMGIVGFFFYLFPFGYWLFQTIKVLPRLPKEGLWSRSLLVVLWLIIFNHIIVSNFIDMRFFPFGLTLWWMTLGLVATIVFPYLNSSE